MQNIELLRQQLNSLVTQVRHDIYTLSSLNDGTVQQQILQRLWDTLSMIHFLSDLLANQAQTNYHFSTLQQPIPIQSGISIPTHIPQVTPAPNSLISQQNQDTFTIADLASFNGKNGRPAYVAVNGIVYDVTNNGAWAAATHFALTAGRDYTQEFSSCHAGQQSILTQLPVVGRLA